MVDWKSKPPHLCKNNPKLRLRHRIGLFLHAWDQFGFFNPPFLKSLNYHNLVDWKIFYSSLNYYFVWNFIFHSLKYFFFSFLFREYVMLMYVVWKLFFIYTWLCKCTNTWSGKCNIVGPEIKAVSKIKTSNWPW